MKHELAKDMMLHAGRIGCFNFEVPADSRLTRVCLGWETLKLWKGARILKRWTRRHTVDLLSVDSSAHWPTRSDFQPLIAWDWPVERGDRVRVYVKSRASGGVARVTCTLSLEVAQ